MFRKSFSIGFHEAGMKRTLQSMLAVNRFDGYDCPGCAWPDPDDHRSSFEFCENGAKAFATEATKKRVTPQKMRGISVTDLSKLTDMELDKMGRITSPLFLKEGEDTYEEIDWGAHSRLSHQGLVGLMIQMRMYSTPVVEPQTRRHSSGGLGKTNRY